MTTLVEIEKTLASGKVDEAFESLQTFLKAEPDNAKAWYLLGSIHRRHQQWGDAINAFNRSKLLDPNGPSDAAIESIYDILRFVNTDLMNP